MVVKEKIELEKIPDILERITAIISREIKLLGTAEALSAEDARTLMAYQSALVSMYKDYRADYKIMKEEIKGKTKEELQQLIKAEIK